MGQSLQDLQKSLYLGVPYWLQFDQYSRRFYGTPPIKNRVFYVVKVSVFDYYDKSDQFIILTPKNRAPQLVPDSIGYTNFLFILGDPISIMLPYIFIDYDGDRLTYQASVKVLKSEQYKTEFEIDKESPFWLNYDANKNHLYGNPRQYRDIPYYADSESFRQQLNVTITVSDVSRAQCNNSFFIYVQNKRPEIKRPYVQLQFDMKISALTTDYNFAFKLNDNSFVDDDKYIKYSLIQTNMRPLPEWMVFDAENLLLQGVPPEKEAFKKYKLALTARDKYQEVSQELKFKIKPSFWYIIKMLIKVFGKLVRGETFVTPPPVPALFDAPQQSSEGERVFSRAPGRGTGTDRLCTDSLPAF